MANIVEQGTHDELLAPGGFYANLYNSQFERVEAEEEALEGLAGPRRAHPAPPGRR